MGPHVAQASQDLTLSLRLALNSWPSFLYHSSTRITGVPKPHPANTSFSPKQLLNTLLAIRFSWMTTGKMVFVSFVQRRWCNAMMINSTKKKNLIKFYLTMTKFKNNYIEQMKWLISYSKILSTLHWTCFNVNQKTFSMCFINMLSHGEVGSHIRLASWCQK